MKKIIMPEAQVDFIHNNKAYGSVAAKLLNNGMDVNKLRNNDVLLYDEWKLLDKAVIEAFRLRAVGVADLMSRNLVYRFNGLAKTVLGWQTQSDISDAELAMDGVTKGVEDRPTYDIGYLPLPIIFKDFSYSIREITESRNGSMPLDTTTAELCAKKVMEKIESILFTGASSYTFGGGTIYGYTDFPHRNEVTMNTQWDSSSATGATIINDVVAMKQASINDRCYGPWVLYIPTAYETVMDEDYGSAYPKTIRQRILEIDGIQSVKVVDFLTANNVLMVQMTSDIVRMVEGMSIRVIQWDTDGGMKVNFKVMAIMVPQLRSDKSLRSGIIHLS